MFTKFLVSASVLSVVSLFAIWGNAAELPTEQAPKCRIVYINGDAMIACPKAPIVKTER